MSEKDTNEQMEEGISLAELWSIFKSRFIWFLITLILVMAGAIVYLNYTIPEYSSKVTVLVDPIKSSSSLDDMLLSGMSSSSSEISTEVELIKSKKTLVSALSLLDLSLYMDSEGNSYDEIYQISSNSEKLSVSSVKDTKIVSISVTDQNPRFAADFANALSKSYDSLLTGIAKNSKTVQREFLEKQIPRNEEELKIASDALSDYREKSGIMQLNEKSASLVNQIAYFEIQKEPLKLQNVDSLSQLESYNNELSVLSIELPEIEELTNYDDFTSLVKKYRSAEFELLMYNMAYSEQWSDTTNGRSSNINSRTSNLLETITQTNNKMIDSLNNVVLVYSDEDVYTNVLLRNYAKIVVDIVRCNVDLDLLAERSEKYTKELDQLPLIQRRLTELERDVTVIQQIGVELRSMLEQVKLTEAAVSGNVTVIDEASIPTIPVSPNVILILAVALLLGMALGFLVCILFDMKDNTIQSRDHLKKILGPYVPVLGWIPLMSNSTDNSIGISTKNKYPALSVYNNPNSLETEKFMSITSNIIYGRRIQGSKVFAITSCDMSAGKTTVISNIAMCLAQMGSRVIIVDGDFRMPSVQSCFGYSDRKIGCVDCIMEDISLKDVILQPIEEVSNLHIMPAGTRPQIPSSILANPGFSEMINVLRDNYDYILFDSPPLEYASEVLAISKISDLIFISARSYITTKESLKALVENLAPVKEKLAGAILNGYIPNSSNSGHYYHYSKYGYSKGYGYDCENKKNPYVANSKHQAKLRYRKSMKNRIKRRSFYKNLNKTSPVAQNIDFDIDFVELHRKSYRFQKIKKNNLSYDSLLKDLEKNKNAVGKE